MALNFEERLPSVARGVQEGSLRKADTAGPFAGESSAAGKIARDVRADVYIVGDIEDLKLNEQAKSAELTLSAQLADAESGDIIKAVVVSGRSPEGASASSKELLALAAGDAVNKLVGELVPGASVPLVEEIQPVEQTGKKFVLKSTSRPAVSPKKMTLVFPFDAADSVASPELGAQIAEWLKSSLSLANGYMAVEFSPRLASIERMIQEGGLKQTDLAGPFAERNSQAAKIASGVGAETYIVGVIDDCKVDADARKAEIALTIQVYDTATARNLQTLAVTGRSPDDVESVKDKDLLTLAAGNAVSNAVSEIVPHAPVVTGTGTASAPVAKSKKRPSTWKMILIGLAVAGGIALASGGGSGDSGIDDDMPPPPQY